MRGMPPEDAPSDARVVLITHPVEGAEAFAARIVERRLAACVNLAPVTSVYRWQGAIERENEVLMVAKTRADRLAALERLLSDEHPYDVPECVSIAPDHVEPSYLAWLLGEAGGASP